MLYKSNLLTLEPYEIYVFGWDMFMMSIVIRPKWPLLLMFMSSDVDDWDRWFLGRAPCTRETLPNFRESGRVTLHS